MIGKESIATDASAVNLMRCNITGRRRLIGTATSMRVLIVDDHRIVASGCRALFADDPDIAILEAPDSESGDPNDLVEEIREVGKGGTYLPPDIARSIAFAGPAFAKNPLSKLTARE